MTRFSTNSSSQKPVLVIIFLRGGCDGLTLVSPTSDTNYIAARSNALRVQRKGDGAGLALKNPLADVDFRLQAQLKPLADLYADGQLAILHAAGLTHATRSHFEAEDYMERGTPGVKATRTGWLARFIDATKPEGILPALAVGDAAPDSLLGAHDTIVAQDLNDIRLASGHGLRPMFLKRLGEGLGNNVLFSQPIKQLMSTGAALEAKAALDNDGNLVRYAPLDGANYPENGLAARLRTVAQTIKLDLGLTVSTVDFGGWDTHVNQQGQIEELCSELSTAIAAFWRDLGPHQEHVTLVVMSEFGRRLKANESGGTDHGHGNAMFVLGQDIQGGQMHGRWPGLENSALDDGADLAITTDYRDVLGEILTRRMGVSDLSVIFPDHKSASPGVIA
jgi:uncharacterized protein (DUF1501 family)